METTKVFRLPGLGSLQGLGSGALSAQVKNADNQHCCLAYWGQKYLLGSPDLPIRAGSYEPSIP